MLQKTYISNLSSLLSLEKQRVIILKHGLQGGAIYSDILTPGEKRKHKKILPERDTLLKKSKRSTPQCINVASFAVIASSAEDFLWVLSMALDKKAWLRDLSIDFIVKGKKDWTRAIEIFEKSRRRNSEFERGHLGGIRSAQVRGAKVDLAADALKEEWALYNLSNFEIVQKYNVSIGALRKRLGARWIARNNKKAALKRMGL